MMEIKRIINNSCLLFFVFSVSHAQEIHTDSIGVSSSDRNQQSEMLMVQSDSSDLPQLDAAREERMQKVWKRRGKYRSVSYGVQTMKSNSTDMKSDMAFGLTTGCTYYLHKKPLAGIMKFGLDWSFLDINVAKYPDLPASENTQTNNADTGMPNLGIWQLEAGMSVGPSLTVNPVDRLKLKLYFRVTPSYSVMIQDKELYHHYATFLNAGLSVSYKIISCGIETRWCGPTNYDGVAMARLNNVYDEEGNFHDPFESIAAKMKTKTLRLFIGLQF